MKAILTRYLGPTNTRGARIVASAEGVARLTVGYPHELDSEAAHAKAAEALANKYGWLQINSLKRGLVSGGLPNGDWAHCFVDRA